MLEDRQKHFDLVLTKLIAQKKGSIQGTRCRMRTEDGRRCAIGHLLDEQTCVTIDTIAGGAGITSEITQKYLPHWMIHDLDFYRDLQITHDLAAFILSDSGFLESFRHGMRMIARRWSLEYNEEAEAASGR